MKRLPPCALFLLAASASSAVAQGPSPPLVWSWKERPSRLEIAAAHPAQEPEGGAAMLRCVLDDQRRPSQCRVILETPPGRGFGAAALSLASRWREPTGPHAGLPAGSALVISTTFPSPEQVFSRLGFVDEAATPKTQPSDWASLPTITAVAAVATHDSQPSTAFVECTVGRGGRLSGCHYPSVRCGTVITGFRDCTPEEKRARVPSDDMLLRVAALGRAPEMSAEGRPSLGRKVRFLVNLPTDATPPLPLPPIPRGIGAPPRRAQPPRSRSPAPPWNPLGSSGA